ncbi:MAG: hypothetical protein IKK55_01775 [Clostridia bacterium]|nr:hypothetical protein [Clostridia bacterium]
MIVLPNSFERYLASLRIFVSLSILKHGLQAKHLEKLQKIHLAEAFFDKNSLQSVDIYRLIQNLLYAISSIKCDFNFSCNAVGNFFINKKLFTILLLKLCEFSDNISLNSQGNYIIIKFHGKSTGVFPIISALKGFSFYETKSNISLIIIPTSKAEAQSVYIESEWEYLFDKFSIVNIFFINVFQ